MMSKLRWFHVGGAGEMIEAGLKRWAESHHGFEVEFGLPCFDAGIFVVDPQGLTVRVFGSMVELGVYFGMKVIVQNHGDNPCTDADVRRLAILEQSEGRILYALNTFEALDRVYREMKT